MRALLVDDHALFREGMKHLLKHLRPDVTIYQAASVREATDILTEHQDVDLILLDLQLPGMRGVQALSAMRQFNDDLPIVVLSGSEDVETVRASIECGAMGFIRKSVNPDEMLSAVETVLAVPARSRSGYARFLGSGSRRTPRCLRNCGSPGGSSGALG